MSGIDTIWPAEPASPAPTAGNSVNSSNFTVELLTQVEIQVLAFQESDVYDIHMAQYTGSRLFRNYLSLNTCLWIQAGGENTYSALRDFLTPRLIALFKIW